MKSLIKNFLVLAIVISLLICIGISVSAQEYHWKIQHIRPVDTDIDKDVTWLVETLKEKSNGRINIDIFPASQLGDYTVVQERVGIGDVEMQLACIGTRMDSSLMLQSLPYIARNWDDAKELYATGSVLMNIIGERLAKQNLKLISGWPCYFGGIATTKEVPEPANPDVPKNIKIRVPPQKSFEIAGESYGFIATPTNWSETFTALQTGIVEGGIGAGAEGYYSNFRDLLKYYYAVNDHFEHWYFYMNMDLWNSLSEEDQKIIEETGLELEKKRFAIAEEREEYNEQRLRDYGIEVITFTDEELDNFAKKIRKSVWPEVEDVIGVELIEQVAEYVH